MQASNEQMDRMTSSMLQAATDMNSMVRDTVNATLQSVTIMAKGCTDLSDNISSLVQRYLEQSLRASQTMMTATSVNDIVDTQNNVIRSSFDSMMSDMNNISQLSTRIAQQAVEPVTRQVNDSISRISRIRAA